MLEASCWYTNKYADGVIATTETEYNVCDPLQNNNAHYISHGASIKSFRKCHITEKAFTKYETMSELCKMAHNSYLSDNDSPHTYHDRSFVLSWYWLYDLGLTVCTASHVGWALLSRYCKRDADDTAYK